VRIISQITETPPGASLTKGFEMTFDEWFRAEFGEPPTDKTAAELDNEVEIANQRYHQARNVLATTKELRRSQHVWSAERNAAKYAWELAKNEVNK